MTIHDQVTDFALGALSDRENRRFRRHLASCEQCGHDLTALQSTLEASAWEQAEEPPAHVRSMVLAEIATTPQVGAAPTRRPWMSLSRPLLVTAAAFTVLLVAFIGIGRLLDNGLSTTDVLAAGDVVFIELEASDPSHQQVDAVLAFSDAHDAAVASFAGLPPPPEGFVYELWVIHDDQAIPSGLFAPTERGEAVVLLTTSITGPVAIGVTLEPAGGSDAPTGEILFLGEVS